MYRIRDYLDRPLSSLPELRALGEQCDAAAATHVGASALGAASPLEPTADALEGLSLPPTDGVRLVYFAMASRPFADATLSRLLRALWAPPHLYLLHVDAKMTAEAAARLRAALPAEPNVRLLRKRRAVQWGGWSMVACMLDALHTVRRLDFDFFINLSDTDLALRTDAEVTAFLGRHRGVDFVSVVPPPLNPLKYRQHGALREYTFVECAGAAGAGFVIANSSSRAIWNTSPRCCFGRSGQIVFAPLPFERAPPPDASVDFFHGSQWVVLSGETSRELAASSWVASLARFMRNTFVPDEAFVQTALMGMGDAARARVVAHNLRLLVWPHQFYNEPEDYWHSTTAPLPDYHSGGPMLLNASMAHAVFASPAMVARKVDPTVDGSILGDWDEWMGAKLRGEAPDPARYGGEQPPLGEPIERIGLHRFRLPRVGEETVPAGAPEQWPAALMPARTLKGRRLRDGTPVMEVEYADGAAGDYLPTTHFGSGDVLLKQTVETLARIQQSERLRREL